MAYRGRHHVCFVDGIALINIATWLNRATDKARSLNASWNLFSTDLIFDGTSMQITVPGGPYIKEVKEETMKSSSEA